MRLSAQEAHRRFAASRSARLATTDAEGHPHLVPVTFAAYDGVVVIAIDHKPKTTRSLKRLRNIADNPHVCLLADEYRDDWEHLWWSRADGTAVVVHEGPEWEKARRHLMERYPQYRDHPPTGPVIVVDVERWSGWAFR